MATIFDAFNAIEPGRYKTTDSELLGAGSEGTVYAVTDLSSGKQFAVKFADPKKMADSKACAKIQSNFEIESNFFSPSRNRRNIVRVVDYRHKDNYHLLFMERAEANLERAPTRFPGAITQDIWLSLFADTLNGLDEFHGLVDAAGKPLSLVHRDVKPSNILIFDEEIKIARLGDFGYFGTAGATSSQKGTLHFAAPETIASFGRTPEYGPASDIFSAAVSFYVVMADKEAPLQQISKELELRLGPNITSEVRDKAALDAYDSFNPRNLDFKGIEFVKEVLVRCMEPKLSVRYTSARDARNDLLQAIADHNKPKVPPKPKMRDRAAMDRDLGAYVTQYSASIGQQLKPENDFLPPQQITRAATLLDSFYQEASRVLSPEELAIYRVKNPLRAMVTDRWNIETTRIPDGISRELDAADTVANKKSLKPEERQGAKDKLEGILVKEKSHFDSVRVWEASFPDIVNAGRG